MESNPNYKILGTIGCCYLLGMEAYDGFIRGNEMDVKMMVLFAMFIFLFNATTEFAKAVWSTGMYFAVFCLSGWDSIAALQARVPLASDSGELITNIIFTIVGAVGFVYSAYSILAGKEIATDFSPKGYYWLAVVACVVSTLLLFLGIHAYVIYLATAILLIVTYHKLNKPSGQKLKWILSIALLIAGIGFLIVFLYHTTHTWRQWSTFIALYTALALPFTFMVVEYVQNKAALSRDE